MKNLPYFIKPGILNWNETGLAFENGCAIHTQRRSKEPAIGFNIDVLYIDEFAKIPDNIIREYYGNVVPTVSSIENSKIIITSTPKGFNLFWELLQGAWKDKDDPLYNGYHALTVKWDEYEGRLDTRVYFNKEKLAKYQLDLEPILNMLKEKYEIYEKFESGSLIHCFKNLAHDEFTRIAEIRKIKITDTVFLSDVSKITNWEEEQTLLIGGHQMFKQEFNLEFLVDEDLLFDSVEFAKIKSGTTVFETLQHPVLDKLTISHAPLKFTNNLSMFNIEDAKKYKIIVTIDLAEGLGIDYSTINIFRLMPKNEEEIFKYQSKFLHVYDYFKLEQIGIWRTNTYGVEEIAPMLYLLLYEIFNPDRVKVVLEMNSGGNLLIKCLKHVFNDKNDFSEAIFFRYKHRETDKIPKIGLKVTGGGEEHRSAKKHLIKQYQLATRKGHIVLHDEMTIREISTFSKKETPGGNTTYKAQSGHDDCIMTLVDLSSVFEHPIYKAIIDDFVDNHMEEGKVREIIMKYLDMDEDKTLLNFKDIYSNIYKKKYPIGVRNISNWWGTGNS